MKKFSLLLLPYLLFAVQSMAQSDVSQARWKSAEIIIDGITNDWSKPLNFYDDKTGLNFAISNDLHHLYFVFTCPEEMKMSRIMSAGWTLQLVSKEKKDKFKASLTFPGARINWMGDRRERDPMERKIVANPLINTYKSQISTIEARGFKSNMHELILNDSKGINIAIGADSLQHVIYEIDIPLKELFDGEVFLPNELITLNITVNAMEKPAMTQGEGEGYQERGGGRSGGGISGFSGGRSGAGRSTGGGRSGGGMSRGGSRGNRSLGQSGLYEKATFKQKFTLAGNL